MADTPKYAVLMRSDGWGAIVISRVNLPDRPVPVYERVAAFEDREEARQYAERLNKETTP